MIWNGFEIECHKICYNVYLLIQGQTFIVDLHVLPINGANVALGIQLLKTLSLVVIDYVKLTLKFIKDDKYIDFKVNAPIIDIMT